MLSDGKIYQDIWIKGRVIMRSGLYNIDGHMFAPGPDCEHRYEVIRKYLPARPLYINDIGSCYGYFPIRLCSDWQHDIRAIAVETLELDFLKFLVHQNGLADSIRIERSLEHWIDTGPHKNSWEGGLVTVLLLLNVLHHLPNWQDVVALIPRYDLTFLMHPPDTDVESENISRVREINAMLRQSFGMHTIGLYASHRTPGEIRKLYKIHGKQL